MSEDQERGAQARGETSAERLVFFSDAVVAIAMTLLVLPLLESLPEAAANGETAIEWLAEHADQLISFVVSFAVSASFWVFHHRLFKHVKSQTPKLMVLNLAWLLVFVFLHVPAAMIYSLPTDRVMIGLYIGTMLAISGLLSAMTVYASRHPGLCDDPVPAGLVASALIMFGLYALALTIAMIFPGINYLSLFVLSLTAPAQKLVMRRRRQSGRS